jgi:membrane-associated phospholipid phosphatase
MGMSRLLVLLSTLMMSFVPSLLACEGCKEPSSVAGASGLSGISAGFSWSVLFMIGTVIFLVSGMVMMMIRACKQLAEQHSAASAQSH